MSSEAPANAAPVDSREPADAEANPLGRGLRIILLLSFGGLLVLLLYSGANALHTLRELHEAEGSARAGSLERRRVLSTVVLSASTYSDHMEAVLLSLTPEQDADAAGDVAKCADQTRAALQAYPTDRSAEEQSLIEQIQQYLAEEDRVFRSAREWKPEERLSRGQAVVSSEIIPKRQRFVAIAQRIEFLNDQQSVAAKQASFAEFGRLQEHLTKFLILTLTSGLLLAIGSAVYIMRLERQGRLRYSELVQSRGELQQLSARLVDAQETERRAISRELHDEVGQALGLLLMDAGRLSNQLGSTNETGQQLVGNIKTVAERTVQTVRNMALLLRPSMLDDLGLVPAVEWYAREMSRRGEIEVEVRAENVSEELPDEVKVGVYRIVQEAVNNVQRHAKAKNAVVELEQAGNAIRVKVTDDGKGFDPKRARGMGLLGMEERVKRLGGTIEIDSRPGGGTTIRAELPLASTRA
jgi:signal transduction histidine kinase